MNFLFLFMGKKSIIDSLLLDQEAWMYNMNDQKPEATGQGICNECMSPLGKTLYEDCKSCIKLLTQYPNF